MTQSEGQIRLSHVSSLDLSKTAACFELRNGGDTPLEASTSFVGQKILLP